MDQRINLNKENFKIFELHENENKTSKFDGRCKNIT